MQEILCVKQKQKQRKTFKKNKILKYQMERKTLRLAYYPNILKS